MNRPATTKKRVGEWDQALGGSAGKKTPGDPPGLRLFELAARLVFSLFITVAYAAGLMLYAGLHPASPISLRACGDVFFWSLTLISCTASRRS
jgi:hypothetical protein